MSWSWLDSPTDSEQLELCLGDARVCVPWGGKSPRGLTRVNRSSILKAQADKSTSDDGGFGQHEMWPPATRGPRLYEGAPSLLPLPEMRDGAS